MTELSKRVARLVRVPRNSPVSLHPLVSIIMQPKRYVILEPIPSIMDALNVAESNWVCQLGTLTRGGYYRSRLTMRPAEIRTTTTRLAHESPPPLRALASWRAGSAKAIAATVTMQSCGAPNMLAQARHQADRPSHIHAARGAAAGVENDIYDVVCAPLVGWWCPTPVERGRGNNIYVIYSLLTPARAAYMWGQTTRSEVHLHPPR